MNILGIYGGVTLGQHDPAAALISNGTLVAACEEERFVRVKSPRGFLPIESIRSCLQEASIRMTDVDLVVHPGETYEDMPLRIQRYLEHYFGFSPSIRMINHQLAHLASTYYCSGFDRAMCLSYDAYGDRVSAALGVATLDGGVRIIETRPRDDSLGLFYATMTSFLGFLVGEDEYKVMGLAPYGEPGIDLSSFACPVADGYQVDTSFMLPDFPVRSMYEPYYSDKLVGLVGQARAPGTPITQHHKNVAYATQQVLEACAMSLVSYLHELTNMTSLCLAGGVGLNCSANRTISELPFVDHFFVQPAASDRGLALGCALQAAYEVGTPIHMLESAFMGPSRTNIDIRKAIDLAGFTCEEIPDPAASAAAMLADGKIVGWYQGRSEFGPRALGDRSTLANPGKASMKDEINARIKFREEFRPFAPSVLEEFCGELFDMKEPSPYMTVAFPVRDVWQDKIPAVVHVNGTARVQTVDTLRAPLYHHLIEEFYKLTGVPAVLNTSFNVRGQPIVESPFDALSTFAGTGLDAVFIGPFKIEKPRFLHR